MTQQELEQPAKVYQVNELQKDIQALNHKFDTSTAALKVSLDEIKTNTTGTVTFTDMKEYVDDRIITKTQGLWDFKRSMTKLGWIIAVLLIGDIATRILK